LPIAPKNLHPEPLHRVSWTHATSIRLSANASTSSPDLLVSESTFQVSTLKGQPFCSLSALGGSSCTQPSALAEGYSAFRLGFPTSCLRRHVGAPTRLNPKSILLYTIILLDFCGAGGGNGGRGTGSPSRRHPIRTNDAPTHTTPHFFYRPDALPAAQPTATKHCRSKKVSVRVVSLSLWRTPTPTHKAVRH